MNHSSYFSFSADTPRHYVSTALMTTGQASWPQPAMSKATLPVPRAVPANHQMPGLILTPVKVQIVLRYQVHIVEYETVPNFIFESFYITHIQEFGTIKLLTSSL